jgi:hypothetical protein
MIVSINLHLPYKSEKLETRTRDNKPAAAVQTAAIISLTSPLAWNSTQNPMHIHCTNKFYLHVGGITS